MFHVFIGRDLSLSTLEHTTQPRHKTTTEIKLFFIISPLECTSTPGFVGIQFDLVSSWVQIEREHTINFTVENNLRDQYLIAKTWIVDDMKNFHHAFHLLLVFGIAVKVVPSIPMFSCSFVLGECICTVCF